MEREEILAQLFEAMNGLKRGLYDHRQGLMQDLPVSATQLELLLTLKHLQPVSARELASAMKVTPGLISQLVDSLIHLELIERQANPADRRTQFLRLSHKGNQQLKRFARARNDLMRHMLAGLSNSELEVLLDIHRKMIDHISSPRVS